MIKAKFLAVLAVVGAIIAPAVVLQVIDLILGTML
jgi:hypothetical protein